MVEVDSEKPLLARTKQPQVSDDTQDANSALPNLSFVQQVTHATNCGVTYTIVGLSMPGAASRFRRAAGWGASLCGPRCHVVNDVPCRDRLLPVFLRQSFSHL
jgi:hypothetical protein